MQTSDIIFNALRKKGYSVEGICGILGNLSAESGLSPNNLEDSYQKKWGISDEQYVREVDSGKRNFIDYAGFGIAQWTFSTRKQKFLAFVKSRGVSIADLGTQIEFLDKELKEDFAYVYSIVHSRCSVDSASDIMLYKFENPEDKSDKVRDQRRNRSYSFYRMYQNAEPADAEPQVTYPDDDGADFSTFVVLSEKTWKKHDIAETIRLRMMLFLHGYALNPQIEDWADTTEVLKSWQEDHNLDIDGICGRDTWSSLCRSEE